MALSYRSPMETVLTTFTTLEQSAVSASAVQWYKNHEAEHFALFNFALPELAKQKLWQSGIYLSPFSAMPHSHPVCKTLENYMLYNVLPSYIDHSFYFVGIKQHKLEFLKKRNKSLSLVSAINRYVTSADKFRYPNDFVTARGCENAGLVRHNTHLNSATLKDLVPAVVERSAKNIFLHDEVHYWDQGTLEAFLSIVKPNKMVFTIVYPPELLVKAKESLNPWCYQFQIDGKTFRYYPDGVRSEGYTQPLLGGAILKANHIVLSDMTIYGVDLLCSKFSHHLIGLTRGKATFAIDRSFSNFEAVSASKIKPICSVIDSVIPIPFEVISKIYRYLRTLNKPDPQSAMAKLSQIVPEPTGFEIKFIQDFSRLVIENGNTRTLFLNSPSDAWLNHILTCLNPILGRFFSDFKGLTLDNFIAHLEPLNFNIKLTAYQNSCCTMESLFDINAKIPGDSVLKVFDQFVGVTPHNAPHVASDKYAVSCTSFDCIEYNHDAIKTFFVNYFVKNRCTRSRFSFSEVSIVKIVKQILLDSKLFGFYAQFITNVWAKSVRGRIRAIFARFAKYNFKNNNQFWFANRSDREYCKYLTNTTDSKYGLFVNTKLYSKVVIDILAQRLKVVGSEEISDNPTDYAPSCSESESTSLESSSFELPATLEPFKCKCELLMPQGEFIGDATLGITFCDELPNRSCAWYSKSSIGYKYGKYSHDSKGWPTFLDAWLDLNGFGGNRFDCMLAQKYQKGAKIGFHADDERIFDKDVEVLTIFAHGTCDFSIRCEAGECGFEAVCGRYLLMPHGMQSDHKHAISNCSSERVSLTFRKLKIRTDDELECSSEDNFECAGEGEQTKPEGVMEELFGTTMDITKGHPLSSFKQIVVPGDGDCFWHCLGYHLDLDGTILKTTFISRAKLELKPNQELQKQFGDKVYAENESIAAACTLFKVKINIIINSNGKTISYTPLIHERTVYVSLLAEHFSPLLPMNDCVVTACAEALGRPIKDIYKVLTRKENQAVFSLFCEGEGLAVDALESFFKIFDIQAQIDYEGDQMIINECGSLIKTFRVADDHILFEKKRSADTFSPKLIGDSGCINSKSFITMRACGTVLPYRISKDRATKLAASLQSGTTGAICSKLFNGAANLYDGVVTPRGVADVCAILGTFGSGKSTLFNNLFRSNPGKLITFVSPRKSLATDFKIKVFGKNFNQATGLVRRDRQNCNFSILTFETFLKSAKNLKSSHTLILDEIQLYPPGYVDLTLSLINPGVRVFLVGDPCQSNYDCEGDRNLFQDSASDVKYLLCDATYKFITKSRRFANNNFVGRMPCNFDVGSLKFFEEYHLATSFEDVRALSDEYNSTFLVPGFDEKKIIKANFPKAKTILTFGESTGRTLRRGTILITQSAFSVCEQRWLTALTRFSENLCIFSLLDISFETIAEEFSSRALGKFLCKTACLDDLNLMLPGTPKFVDQYQIKIGKDWSVKENKLLGDPWLKTEIFLGQESDMEEIEILEEVCREPWFKTHLQRCEMESARARWVHLIKAKEKREVRKGCLVSEQFTDQHAKNRGTQLTNAAERFETIYPRHRSSDTVTFLMAVKKRLRFSKPMVECAKLREAENYGKYLLDIFLNHVPLDAKHDANMMRESCDEFEDKKTSKSAAVIENHAGRSCRDWLADVGLVFMKSQHCTKFDNRFRDAKAAQSIVCFQHSVLCRFAPYMRYMEKKLTKALPTNFYIHSGKGLDVLNLWVKKHKFSGICTESDYEAFDASQDEYIVAFELACMKFLGLPKDLIADYRYIKTHLGSKLGSFAIMRFSGEASTFLFNTMANMLFTFMKYDINGKEAICFAGDDMCAAKRLRLSTTHEAFLSKLRLKAKVQFVSTPTFCGWCLTPSGIYKKPQLVFERLCIAKETNNLANCIDNYAIEVAFAYCLGEKLLVYMSEEDLESHYNCVRIIIKNKHILKSDVRLCFEVST